MNLQDFQSLSPDQQRETLQDMHRQIREKYQAAFDELCVHDQLEGSLLPKIEFKVAPPSTDYPEAPPLRQGIDQEEYVRRIFRSDPGIRELRTADGNIYTRK